MDITCGIFLINSNSELLICHPTNAPAHSWGIPKGLRDDGEDNYTAAIRELFEETGLNLSSYEHSLIKVFEQIPYKNGKKILASFLVKIKNGPTAESLFCNSMVECKKPFPEVDMFKWVSIEEAEKLIHYTQKALISQIKLIYL